MNKIAIIINTFMRDELLSKSIESLKKNWQDNVELIIVDQGVRGQDKIHNMETSSLGYHYISIPYNSGLSRSRNIGVSLAQEYGCDYCIIASDSFLFNESIKKINNLVDILKGTSYDLIGMELSGCVCDWEAELNLIEGESFELDFINKGMGSEVFPFFLKYPTSVSEFLRKTTPSMKDEDVVNIWNCDIMRNFFIAKTSTLIDVQWDDNFKLGEHEDFFWQYKQAGYKCGWTNYIDAEKMKDRPDEYAKFRKINFNAGLAYLRKKYNISGWVTYKHLSRAKRNKK